MSEQLRHKMIDFEVEPPPVAWEAIAARLDDDKQYAFVAAKMNNFDATPPPQAWDNILSALEETKKDQTPLRNIRSIIYRLAAAAIIIGLFIGGWMMINKKTLKTNLVKNTNTNLIAPVHTEPKEENTAITENDVRANQNAEIVSEQNNDYKKHIVRYATISGLPAYHARPIVIPSSPILDKEGQPIHDLEVLTTNSNYLLVTGPNGQLTRISSKFANVIRYLNGSSDTDTEEYLDKVIKESDTWKKRFQEWRSKISQSSFIPSASNFLDIVEFKELIQEK